MNFKEYSSLDLISLSVAIILAFLFSIFIVALVLIQMPENYLIRPEPDFRNYKNSLKSFLIVIARNLLGLFLIVLGIILLFLPGQGILSIIIGLLFMDLPGKHKLIVRLFKRPKVMDAVNKIRVRFGKAPLILEENNVSLR